MTQYDAGNAAEVKTQEDWQSFYRERELEDLRQILEIDAGRRVLWRLLEKTRMMQLSYVPGGLKEDFYFNEGKKSIGYYLVAEMADALPEAYTKMQLENLAAKE